MFRRAFRVLTAMGRASAWVLLGMPFAMGALLYLVNPDYMAPLFGTGAGKLMLGTAITMMGFGALVLRKIVNFRH